MISAIVHGTIVGTPEQLTTKYDKPYARAKLRVISDAVGDFVSIVCFDEAPCIALLALTDGDTVAVSGTLKAKPYVDKMMEPRSGLDMVVRSIMTPYQVIDKMEFIQKMEQAPYHDD